MLLLRLIGFIMLCFIKIKLGFVINDLIFFLFFVSMLFKFIIVWFLVISFFVKLLLIKL